MILNNYVRIVTIKLNKDKKMIIFYVTCKNVEAKTHLQNIKELLLNDLHLNVSV